MGTEMGIASLCTWVSCSALHSLITRNCNGLMWTIGYIPVPAALLVPFPWLPELHRAWKASAEKQMGAFGPFNLWVSVLQP